MRPTRPAPLTTGSYTLTPPVLPTSMVTVEYQAVVERIAELYPNSAKVTLITDQQSFVDAMVQPGGAQGIISGSVTGDVTLQYLDKNERVKVGQYVVTSGRQDSVFVRGIPVGQIASVGSQEVELYQSISLDPFVDFRKLDLVQVVVR